MLGSTVGTQPRRRWASKPFKRGSLSSIQRGFKALSCRKTENPVRAPSLGDSIQIWGLHPILSPIFALYLRFSACDKEIRIILLNVSPESFLRGSRVKGPWIYSRDLCGAVQFGVVPGTVQAVVRVCCPCSLGWKASRCWCVGAHYGDILCMLVCLMSASDLEPASKADLLLGVCAS